MQATAARGAAAPSAAAWPAPPNLGTRPHPSLPCSHRPNLHTSTPAHRMIISSSGDSPAMRCGTISGCLVSTTVRCRRSNVVFSSAACWSMMKRSRPRLRMDWGQGGGSVGGAEGGDSRVR
eukprot:110468-Chlamydomonas_euryale.AAC.2